MSLLNDIINQTKLKKRHTEEWIILKNAYFRGDTGFENLQKWASENKLKVSTETYIDKDRKERTRIIFYSTE